MKEKQNRIGMNQTVGTDNAQAKGGIFKEYVIPAGKAVNIIPSHLTSQTVCRVAGKPCQIETKELCKYGQADNILQELLLRAVTLGAYEGEEARDDRHSFIPVAGQQYEYMPTGCAVTINDITEENISTVKLSPIYQCE